MDNTHAITVFSLLLFAACGGAMNYQMKGSDLSPGADATLSADVQPARNLTHLELKAKNLVPAQRVGEGANTYVVWARPNFRTAWMRLGALNLSDDGRSGSAKLTYAEKEFDLLVTAEPDPEVSSPSKMHVFRQHVGNENS